MENNVVPNWEGAFKLSFIGNSRNVFTTSKFDSRRNFNIGKLVAKATSMLLAPSPKSNKSRSGGGVLHQLGQISC